MTMATAGAQLQAAPLPGGNAPMLDATRASLIERKIIRNATLTLEAPNPEEIRSKVQALAEGKGGFVLSSDTTRSGGVVNVKIVVRVPAAQFPGVMEALHVTGARVAQENVTGQDVTDEFYDLEARLRSQRAIEAQYLEILKRAVTIKDTLDVQQKLGEIRTEIERAEGRRRLLENQASLSTLTITIVREAPPAVVVESGIFSGFARDLKHAVRDAADVAIGIVSGAIRLVGVLLPVFVLIVLPFGVFVRFLMRRRARRLAAERAAWAPRPSEAARAPVASTPNADPGSRDTVSDPT